MSRFRGKMIKDASSKFDDYRRILWNISRDEAVNRLNNSVLEDKGAL